MSGYVLSDDAVLDLENIWDFIAQDNIDAADNWINKLFAAFEVIGQMPGVGHQREDLTNLPVLFFPVGAYLIIYRAANNLEAKTMIEIVAVTQGGRDIPSFLQRRLSP